MNGKEIKDILKLSADEIFDYITKNPEHSDEILNELKFKEKVKFLKVSGDLKSYKLNNRGSAALKKDILENIAKDGALLNLRVEDIEPNPKQPRKIFNEDKLIELSETIKEHGLLKPILVNKVKGKDKYILIAGERRLRAHKIANMENIKSIVIEVTDEIADALAIIENEQVESLTPVEQGKSYLELQTNWNYSLRDIAKKIGKNKNYVAARLNLTKFDDDCLDFILKQNITNVAKLLKILETESTNHKMLLEKLSKNDLSSEDIEKFKVDNIKKLPDEKIEDKKPSKAKDINHDKFNDDGDFSQEKKEAKVEALSEKIRGDENKEKELPEEKESVIKETAAIKITGIKSKKVNISIDVENMTGKDFETLKEFIATL